MTTSKYILTADMRSLRGIDSGYFKWHEMEFNTLMNTDFPEKLPKTNFRD
jgi:hypothetical protein